MTGAIVVLVVPPAPSGEIELAPSVTVQPVIVPLPMNR